MYRVRTGAILLAIVLVAAACGPEADISTSLPGTTTDGQTAPDGEWVLEIEDGKRELAKLDAQVAARTRALPLYQQTLGSDDLADALRQRRDHPMHALLRRLYHEQWSLAGEGEKS